jgi:peptide/nickel transport system substrate-binding protein/oligopeptide transport system substrate-binding protein
MLGDIPTNHLVPAGMPGYDPSLLGPDETTSTTGNVTLARQLLQSYADDDCHGQFSRCPQVNVWSSFNPGGCGGNEDPTILNYESRAIEMWREAFPGYPIKGSLTPGTSCLLGLPPIVPQVYSAGWIADYADAQDWLSLQFEPEAPYSPYNPASVDVPTANALMAQADQTLDPTERIALYNQAEQLLVFNVAWIPIGQSLAYYNIRSTVSGLALTGLGYPSLDQWYGIQMMNR